MRSQWCREHIEKTAQECDLGPDIVSEVKEVAKFCASNPAFADCATRPIYVLIKQNDVEVRNKAISLAQNALNAQTPVGGRKKKILTEKEIGSLIKKARVEVRGELTEKYKEERTPGPGSAKEPEKDRVVDVNKSIVEEAPVQPPLSAQMAGTVPPEPQVYRPPPCLGGGGCDRGKFRSDKVRGNVCDAIGAPINQLPGNVCPYDVKLPRKSDSAFVPASQLTTANKDPGGKPAIPDRTLTIRFSPDQWAILGKLQKTGMADGYDGAVLFCVDEIGNRSGN
jgi:hypothetical protein